MYASAGVRLIAATALIVGAASVAGAQEAEPTREQVIVDAQDAKDNALHAYVPGKGERLLDKAQEILVDGLTWRPWFESAYNGAGFTLGAAYLRHTSAFTTLDVRGSYSIRGYKRGEVAYTAPRLFDRRGTLTVLGGWREATQVGFYGFGTDNTSKDDRVNYDFRQPYASADLMFRPTRHGLLLRGNLEWTQWEQRPGHGSHPSVETVFTPDTLPGLGAKPTYVHTQATLGYDWRTSPGYSRRGGFYGVTGHDYTDSNGRFGFRQVDYEAIQHFPILREAWVVSLRGQVQTAFRKSDQEIPFFMQPALGGGSTLRGFSSWRFRDENSVLLQAEWRIMVNRFFDTAVFYDTGKVTNRRADIDLRNLKSNYGFGARFHGPFQTALRAEIARSNEGLAFIFAFSPVF